MGPPRFARFSPIAFATTIALASVGCSSAAGPAPASTNPPEPPAAEAPASAPLDCEPGTMASIERGQCVPVGPKTIALSFARAPNGWGIVAARPAALCAATERPALGNATCLPLDDGCNGVFPPAAATIVVVPGAVSEGKTVGTLEEALSRAQSGDTIALDAGEYATFETRKAIHVVGRCAAQVILRPTGTRTTGVFFTGPGASSVERLTIEGARTGLRAAVKGAEVTAYRVHISMNDNGIDSTGGKVIVRESVIDGAWTEKRPATIAIAAQSGGTVEVTDSAVQRCGTCIASYGAGARVVLRRAVVRGPDVETKTLSSVLLSAGEGGVADIEESVFVTTQTLLMTESGTPDAQGNAASGTIRIARSELTQTGHAEVAVALTEGGRLELEDTSVFHHADFGVGLLGGEITMTRSAIVADPKPLGPGDFDRSPFDVSARSRVSLVESALVGGQGIAVSVRGASSSFTMDQSLALGTRFGAKKGRTIEVGDQGVVTLRGSTISSSEGTALLVGKDGVANVVTSLIDAPSHHPGSEASTGVGILVHESSCTLDRVLVRRAAGPAFTFASGKALVKSSRLSDSRVGLLMLDTSSMLEVEDEPEDLVPGMLILHKTRIEGNADRVLQADGVL